MIIQHNASAPYFANRLYNIGSSFTAYFALSIAKIDPLNLYRYKSVI
jgi:hypothetical protein